MAKDEEGAIWQILGTPLNNKKCILHVSIIYGGSLPIICNLQQAEEARALSLHLKWDTSFYCVQKILHFKNLDSPLGTPCNAPS